MSLTPIEYEQYCASQLRLEGWNVRATSVTGDQGADVIAESGSMRVIVQCKQYSQPVGNSAVQEVIAARIYYEGDVALVVSNAPFTKSATDLAKKAAVHLMHHSKLRAWAKNNSRAKPNAGLKAEELVLALNLHQFRVTQRANGGYAIKTPQGMQYANGDGAFIQIAERLLCKP